MAFLAQALPLSPRALQFRISLHVAPRGRTFQVVGGEAKSETEVATAKGDKTATAKAQYQAFGDKTAAAKRGTEAAAA